MKKPKVSRVPDCQNCGACCLASAEGQGVADLLPGERDALRIYERVHLIEKGSYLNPFYSTRDRLSKYGDLRCTFLRGPVLDPYEECSCRIYDRRPGACRDFQPGCDWCLDAIHEYRKESQE